MLNCTLKTCCFFFASKISKQSLCALSKKSTEQKVKGFFCIRTKLKKVHTAH